MAIGMCIPFPRIPCSLVTPGVVIMKGFFGADLDDFFVCLLLVRKYVSWVLQGRGPASRFSL